MNLYIEIALGSFSSYWNYLKAEVIHPGWHNYFYWLLALSLFIWLLELVIPWRRKQPILRQDFWLDLFYVFFNFFLFSLVGFNALSNVGVAAFNDVLGWLGMHNAVAIQIQEWPKWGQLLTLFIVADFVQWNVHRMLHRVPWLWRFHQVHHSVQQMGFAAHLRFHWMETIIYKSLQYIPLAMIGFGIDDFFIVHQFTILIGHLNHANVKLNYGPLKYLLNNPAMHIWHHAKDLPEHLSGVNFGISLSLWDYLFGTAYIPHDGRDIELGFEEVEKYPHGFWGQTLQPFKKK